MDQRSPHAISQRVLHEGVRKTFLLSDIASVKRLIEGNAERNAALMKSSDPHPLVLSFPSKTQKGHLYR